VALQFRSPTALADLRTFQPTHSRSHGVESPAAIREASTADVLVFTESRPTTRHSPTC
jgi:hypothetical protein